MHASELSSSLTYLKRSRFPTSRSASSAPRFQICLKVSLQAQPCAWVRHLPLQRRGSARSRKALPPLSMLHAVQPPSQASLSSPPARASKLAYPKSISSVQLQTFLEVPDRWLTAVWTNLCRCTTPEVLIYPNKPTHLLQSFPSLKAALLHALRG